MVSNPSVHGTVVNVAHSNARLRAKRPKPAVENDEAMSCVAISDKQGNVCQERCHTAKQIAHPKSEGHNCIDCQFNVTDQEHGKLYLMAECVTHALRKQAILKRRVY